MRLSPVINHFAQHAHLRIAGSVYFEIAAKYAEKAGGTITQHQNVKGCTVDDSRLLLLADYPVMPLQWDRVCTGFREVLLDGGLVHAHSHTSQRYSNSSLRPLTGHEAEMEFFDGTC